MKQTAVEWLEEQIKDIFYVAEASEMIKQFKSVYEQAKEMEKQQIIDAYKDSTCQFSVDSRIDCPKSAEQYYNETFKNK